MIRRYKCSGVFGGSTTYEAVLCQYHAGLKRARSREVKELPQAPPENAKCEDCRPAKGPYVIDRVIAEADKAARAVEPAPPKVLKGQRRLF